MLLANPKTIRRRAFKHVRLLTNIERRGVVAASRIGFRAMAATIAAYKLRTVDPLEALAREFIKAEPILTQAKIVAYLEGASLAQLSARRARLPFNLAEEFDKQIDFTAQSLGVTQGAIKEISATYALEAAAVLEATGTRVQAAVLETMVVAQREDLHVRAGVRALRDTFAREGITPRSASTLEAIFRTEIQKSNAAGHWQFNQKPEIQEALWGYRYVTAGDARVRPTHRGLEGVTLPKDHPRWNEIFPPNGINCRCQTVGLFDPPDKEIPPASEFTTVQNGKSITVVPGADPGFRVNFGQVFAGGIFGI